MTVTQNSFDRLATWATSRLQGDDVLLLNVDAEDTDFIRFNHNQVRQAGTVSQAVLSVQFIRGSRHVQGSTPLTGELVADQARVGRVLDLLSAQIDQVPEDPFLLWNAQPVSTEQLVASSLPDADQALGEITGAGAGKDLVGIYTAGQTMRGFANSLGQRNWFDTSTFNFDWTFYLEADKAVKNGYAGFDWNDQEFAQKVAWSAQQLEALARPAIALDPGAYRTYLAPSAVDEVIGLLSWESFSARSQQTKQSALMRMADGDAELSTNANLVEDTAAGAGPGFQAQGFVKPKSVALVTDGKHAGALISPRSAQEYGLETNGANDSETPTALSLRPGTAATGTAVERLGEGLYVGNLWYTNYSDRPACRVTGMTRFATFWVEAGEVKAPVNVLRFDDTVYNMLGTNLIELDDEAEVMLDASTYFGRSTGSVRLPGALLESMQFTL